MAPESPTVVPRSARWGAVLAWILPVAVGLGVRLVGVGAVLTPDGIRLVDPDSYYHSYRIAVAREAAPHLPPFHDPLVGHPQGYVQHWPPGMDYLGGGAARIAGVTSDEGIARLGTLLVVVLGALTPLVVVALLWPLTTPLWACLGGLVLALWPLHIEYSRIGRVDHHVLEPLVTAIAALFYLRALRAATQTRRWLALAASGCAVGAAIWLWPSALLPLSVLGAGMIGHQLLLGAPARPAPVFAIGLGLASPLCLAAPYRGEWVLHAPSPLHLLVLAAVALASLWLTAWTRLWRLWRRTRAGELAAATPGLLSRAASLLVLACLLALVLVRLPLRPGVELALTFGGRQGLWGLIFEQSPLTALSWGHAVLILTYLFLALPLLVALAMRAPGPPGRRSAVRLLTFWAGALTLVGTAQIRFLPLALVLAAPLAALGAAELSRWLTSTLQHRARPSLLRWTAPTVFAGTLGLLWPAFDYLDVGQQLPGPSTRGIEEASRWLRAHAGSPPGGVLASLGSGHPLVFLGRVPVVGSTLIAPSTETANRDVLTFLTTGDLDEARRIAQKREVGWVVLTGLTSSSYARFQRYLGRPWRRDHVRHQHRRCTSVRLSHDRGSGAALTAEHLPAIPWLQHRWESWPVFAQRSCHVFRVVNGARLGGRTEPGALVTLTLPLVTNRGEPFEFRDYRRADSLGRFAFRLPYATATGAPPEVIRYQQAIRRLQEALSRGERRLQPVLPLDLPATVAVGPATIAAPGWEVRLSVSQEDVLLGRVLPVHAPLADATSRPAEDRGQMTPPPRLETPSGRGAGQ